MVQPLTILVAEDEEGDALLLKMAFKRAASPHVLKIVHDGQEVVDYLTGEAPYKDRSQHPLPDLVLLDLKMPRMTGFDVLTWLAEQPKFKTLPTIVLSSFTQESDIRRARTLGALEYYVKPTEFSALVTLTKVFHTRWLESMAVTPP